MAILCNRVYIKFGAKRTMHCRSACWVDWLDCDSAAHGAKHPNMTYIEATVLLSCLC